jgi:hypothetical protein
MDLDDAFEHKQINSANWQQRQEKDSHSNDQQNAVFNDLNSDSNTLKQLRVQKMLLKSIRQRREELKALEGRKKALEALKKIAFDANEKQMDSLNTKIASNDSESNLNESVNTTLNENNSFITDSKKPKLKSDLKDDLMVGALSYDSITRLRNLD